jgi:hypothetical protein
MKLNEAVAQHMSDKSALLAVTVTAILSALAGFLYGAEIINIIGIGLVGGAMLVGFSIVTAGITLKRGEYTTLLVSHIKHNHKEIFQDRKNGKFLHVPNSIRSEIQEKYGESGINWLLFVDGEVSLGL